MLTPQEISEKEFVKAVFGGYDMSAVDDFLESLTADYSLLYKENAILKSKIKVLVEKVEEYRSTEDAMRMALLTAQKMGDEIMSEAQKKSDTLLRDTENEVAAKLAESEKLLQNEEYRLNCAKKATEAYISTSRDLMQQHAEYLRNLKELCKPEEQPTREDAIVDTAREIDSAVSRLVDDEADGFNDSGETKKVPSPEDVAEALRRAMAGTDMQMPDVDTMVVDYGGEAASDDEDEPTKVYPVAGENEDA